MFEYLFFIIVGFGYLHLQLCHLKLLGLGDSLLLIPHTEHVSLSESLVQGAAKVLLGADLLLVVILHASDLMLSVPECADMLDLFLSYYWKVKMSALLLHMYMLKERFFVKGELYRILAIIRRSRI